jgi:hypothetical protein
MDNVWNITLVLAVGIVSAAYYFDIGGIATEKEEKMVYVCQEMRDGIPSIYFSKQNVKGDNCTPASPIMIKQDLISGIRDTNSSK